MVRKLQDSDLAAFELFVKNIKPSLFMNWSQEQLLECWKLYELWGCFDSHDLQSVLCVRGVMNDFEVLWIQTQPQFLKKGCASRLLSDWLDFASQQAGIVFLEVHQINRPAIGLYKKLGFEKLGTRHNYYSDGGSAISFQLDLAKVKRPS